jgi:hypothetical protein
MPRTLRGDPLIDLTAAHNADFEPVDVVAFGAFGPREPMRRLEFIGLIGGGVAARGQRAAGRVDAAYGSPAALEEAA